MCFTIFGLGDSSYEQYNEIGKQYDKDFESLGGHRVYRLGDGNAETFSTEDDFNKWKEDLWPAVFKHFSEYDTEE